MPKGKLRKTHLRAKCNTIYCISQYRNTIFRFSGARAKIRTRPRIYFVNGKNHLLNLENAAPICGCIDLSGSYTGSADSMLLRACRGSAAQRQPANTRPEARAQEMARIQFQVNTNSSLWLKFLYHFLQRRSALGSQSERISPAIPLVARFQQKHSGRYYRNSYTSGIWRR